MDKINIGVNKWGFLKKMIDFVQILFTDMSPPENNLYHITSQNDNFDQSYP